ncbi:MAG: ABC transporter ATP-binding protein [Acidobacteria bacterium]|nr:ABC transporter ATP-binding protein [Acidobacteriota bacterium]
MINTIDPVISTKNLTIKFGKFTAVNKVSFQVKTGEIFGLLGPNGSGKTTIIKALCGLITHATGEGKILGLDIHKDSFKIKKRIGYMSQKFSLYEELTVNENLDFYAGIYHMKKDQIKLRKPEVLELTGLTPYLERRAGALSGGWKQRLALGCAIIHEPEVLFLDEPTAGIDPVARRALWDLLFKLSANGITIFVTTHYMDEAERCRRVGYIYLSNLIAVGTVDELRTLPEVSPVGSTRLEILSSSPSEALSFIKDLPYVWESTIFGQSIHVLCEKTQSSSKLKEDLETAGFTNLVINPIRPSLEDIFVTLTNNITNNISLLGGTKL